MGISPRTLRPSSTFTPRSISGLALWLDASSSDLYTTDAGPVVAVASPLDIAGCALWLDGADSSAASMTLDGTLVSSWRDKSGNGRDFTASGTARPTLTASGLNGKSVVTFDGSNDQLTNATNVVGFSSVTMFAVVYRQTGAYGGIITSTSADNTPALIIENSNIGVRGHGQISVNTGGFTGPAVVCGRVNAGATEIFTDGLVRDSDAVSGSLGSVTTTAIGTYRLAAANYLNGYIAEIIVYPTDLTTADRARVEAYLAAKWSISGVHAPATATSDPVGYWGDKSGNGRHVTTSDASTRPVIHSATHNGRKVLDFDGTNDTLSRDNYTAESDLTGLTRFGVFYSDSGAGPFHLSSVYSGGSYSSFASASSLLTTHAGLSDSSQHANVSSVLTSGTTPRVFCARYDGTAGSFATGLNIIMDGVTLPVASTTGTFPSSLPGGSPSLFIGSNIRANNWLNGKLCEYISYARALTTAERQRVERYLAARWGITLAPQVANADAQDWINRVYANGGTVSSATAGAVNTFCESIASAGIRDRFYRMGIFAGSNLNAALVPLYRGPSLGGTQYGGTTDTNNAFVGVGTDYAETGATGGLLGNGTTKYLNTGFNVDQLPGAANCHLSSFITGTQDITAVRSLVGVLFNGVTDRYRLFLRSDTSTPPNYSVQVDLGKTDSASQTNRTNTSSGLFVGSRTSTTSLALYANAVEVGTNGATVAETTGAFPFLVFARTGPTEFYNGRMAAYSIGAGMTAAQVTAYNTAIQAFQTALGRA